MIYWGLHDGLVLLAYGLPLCGVCG